MIYRLRYCNKDGVEARVDIQKGLATPIIDIEGTERPFTLSYNNDKGNKSGMFLSSSADIEIYETEDFNIDKLKTSNETELSVTHYINNVVRWKGFIIPDFFSIEVRNNPVIAMTASDRLGTLKNVTLSDLPSMISLRELAILCLDKTGLELPLRTMADFNNGTGVNDFFNSKILTQRLSDTKGRSISCYDILSSILTASNSKLLQRGGKWVIINKVQHEAGSGKLYTGATSFINWSDVIFNFSDINVGGRRTIIPVASTVGVFHEFGGGRIYPENYDFSLDLTGWTAVNGFVAAIDNRKVDNFVSGTGVIPQEWTTDPVFGEPTEKKYLVNDNYGINYDFADKPYLRSSNIPVTYPNISQVKVNVEVNATGPYIDSETYRGETNFAVIASNGTSTLHLTGSGTFEPLSGDPFLHKVLFDGDTHLQAVTSSRSVNGVLSVQEGNLSGYNITIRIYGYTKGVTGGRFLVTTLVNSVAVTITDISDEAKGILYKTERVDNFTKAHDIDTSLFADYLTTGLNGYFYSFPIDDTSLIYNSNNELTSKWTAYNDSDQLPLLQHITRQRSRLFSVAHDLLSAEIEASDFDPLAIFVACEKRYTVVSAQFDFFRSNLSVELEEVAFQSANVRDFIYSYFGDGESGIKSIGGVSGGAGGSTGGGLTPEQLEVLSFWKKDPDNPNTIFTEMNAYSKLELSAYGAGDGGGGGGGSDYKRLDTWADYDSSKAGWVLSAFLGNDLNTRVTAIDGRVTDLENSAGGEILSFVTSGTGNAVTSIAKSGTVVTAYKSGSFLPLTGGTLTGNINITPIEGTLGVRTHRVGGSDHMWPYGTSLSSIRTGLGFGWYDTEWIIGNIRGGATDSYGFGIGYRNANGDLGGEFRVAPGGVAYLNNVAIATVNSNVASATKLQTARTIWGQSFDGTENVTGALSGATTITATGNILTSANLIANTGITIAQTAGTGVGLSLYGTAGTDTSTNPTYGIMFALTANKGTHGAVTGTHATYFTMDTSPGRGWIFTTSAAGTTGNVASISNTGNITASGEVTAFVASDIRLKQNIKPINSALETINRLNPVSYNWNAKAKELNSNKSNKLDYGLIAQEVESVLPNIVHGIFDNKYKGVDYIKLIPVMISAIKELKAEINRLKN